MLQLVNVRKAYKTAGFEQIALDDVGIAFRDSEFVAILGPSGSGKTTLLNIVGGLDHYDSGDLIIEGISTRQYKDRDWDTYRNNRIGFVFQSYNLIPHQTVLVNVELALTLSGVSKAQRRERALAALEEVGLTEHVHKKPNQLSGGQMQRVAIARALINDPEIVLADEPTGALDSKTSVQIMALLTEIAQNRLVIMVTHNPELAEQYANRIISLHDGQVVADSNPFLPTQDDLLDKEKSIRRTAMSFLTALSLSFTNLLTKKGRTIMTAFAGSIGIIGIAAILALANGVNNYIADVEESMLTVYPLTIQSTGLDLTALISSSLGGSSDGSSDGTDGTTSEGTGGATQATQQVVRETKMVTGMFGSIGQNDLAALKTFIDEDGGGISAHVNAIEYSYDVTPQLFSADTTEGTVQVNPDFITKMMGGGSSNMSRYAGMGMGMNINTNMFAPMIENTSLLVDQYDVVAGRWPESPTECVVVLNLRGGIDDYLLYIMGLRDLDEFKTMIEQFQNEEDIITPEDTLDVPYEDILAVTFKMVPSAKFYTYDETYKVWTDRQNDKEYMKGLVDEGETLQVVGILKAGEDSLGASMSSGIYYPASLTYHLMELSAQEPIVKDQLANREVNVFTGKTFEEEKESSGAAGFGFEDLMTVDEDAITNAFSVDSSKLNIDLSGALDPNALMGNMPPMPALDLADFASQLDIDLPEAELTAIATSVLQEYLAYCFANGMLTPDAIMGGLPDYLNRPEVQARIAAELDATVDLQALQDELQASINAYIQQAMGSYMTTVLQGMQAQITTALTKAMSQLSTNMASAMSFNQDAFADAFQFNLSEEELSQVVMTMMSADSNTYDNNLRKLGYASLEKPSGISIYPINFENKQKVIEILDDYNQQMKDAEQDDKLIAYTDIVGLLMTSVTTIVDMISMVLVAFVAISLVVSSIMIGVITYISVLERKKEIGILRAMGARKRDIGNVFNAETMIVGLVAGVMGILITLVLTIPANIIVEANVGVHNIALLPLLPAVALIVVSVALTFGAGLIPSSAASRRDPVEALRSE